MHRMLLAMRGRRLTVSAVLATVASCVQAPAAAQRTVSCTATEGTWISLNVAPDGQSIAFERLCDVYRLAINGGTATPILTGAAFHSQPRFSPDGTRLAFISDGTGSNNIWIAAADGSGARALSSFPARLVHVLRATDSSYGTRTTC